MKNSPSRANSFLIEMILVMLFFSISVAITLGLFVEAHANSVESKEKSHAMMLAQTTIEQVKAGYSDLSFIDGGNVVKDDNGTSCVVMYDDDWEVSSSAHYTMEVLVKSDFGMSGNMRSVDVVVTKKKGDSETEQVYSLSSSQYLPNN